MRKNIFHQATPGLSPGLLVHEATKSIRDGMVYPTRPADDAAEPGTWVDRLFPVASSQPLAPSADPFALDRHSCLETYVQRRSQRTYADQDFTRDDLARLLALAYPPEVAEPGYGASGAIDGGLKPWAAHVTSCKLFPLVLNMSDLAAGAYAYDERQRQIRPIRPEDPIDLVQARFFQAEFTKAPVIVLLVGSLADCIARHGDRGYRYMLLEAGMMIQHLYLAASYLDLSASVTGSLVHDDFNQWLGLDGYHASVLMAFVAGHPQQEEQSDAQ
jgi:SagB-type dehydrogenase family enzyme